MGTESEPYGFASDGVRRNRRVRAVVGRLVEPGLDRILAFCADDPVERVFLEDVARRGLGRFVGLVEDDLLVGLCHVGVNAVPSGRGCGSFARDVGRTGPAHAHR